MKGELKEIESFGVPDEQFSDNGQPVLIGARNACGNCGWLGSIVYNAGTGGLSVDAPSGADLTSINIDSARCMFDPGRQRRHLGFC